MRNEKYIFNETRKRLLQEADKSRFIEPIFNTEYLEYATPLNLQHELRLRYENAKSLPKKETLIAWVNSGASDKLKIDWNLIKNVDDANWPTVDEELAPQWKEVARLFQGFIDYKESGGSRKEKKAYRVSFKNENDFFILPIKSKYWTFVAPRNHKACVYMDSAECGGQSAKWCIGTEGDDTHWRDYLKQDNMFVLAIKTAEAPAHVNDNDYDDHGRHIAKKYMIQVLAATEWLDADPIAWRPCDDPYDKVQNEAFVDLFGVTGDELAKALGDYRKIVNDFTEWKPKIEEILNGTWVPPRSCEETLIEDVEIKEFNIGEILEMYGDRLKGYLLIKDSDIKTLRTIDIYKDYDFYFENCSIHDLYMTPMLDHGDRLHFKKCDICCIEYADIEETVKLDMEAAAEEDEDFDEEHFDYESAVEVAWQCLYGDNGTEFENCEIRDQIFR